MIKSGYSSRPSPLFSLLLKPEVPKPFDWNPAPPRSFERPDEPKPVFPNPPVVPSEVPPRPVPKPDDPEVVPKPAEPKPPEVPKSDFPIPKFLSYWLESPVPPSKSLVPRNSLLLKSSIFLSKIGLSVLKPSD